MANSNSSEVVGIFVKPKTEGEHGLPKIAVQSALVSSHGFENDYNHYRHWRWKDTPDRAVLILTTDILKQLNAEGYLVKPGDVGENLLIDGIAYNDLKKGNIVTIGNIEIQITQACTPCKNLRSLPYASVDFIKAIMGRRGWYAKVLREGVVRTGDKVTRSST